MRTISVRTRVASFVVVVALLTQVLAALAADQDHDNRPVEVTFTKWVVPPPAPPPAPQPPFALLAGVTGGDIVGTFVGEVLWGQTSFNGHVRGLEALYEVALPLPIDPRGAGPRWDALPLGGDVITFPGPTGGS